MKEEDTDTRVVYSQYPKALATAASIEPGPTEGSALARLDALAASNARRDGWYDNALAVTDAALAAVRRFLSYPTAIVPSVNGGIQLEWHTADVDMELEFDAAGKPDALYGTRASDGFDLTSDTELEDIWALLTTYGMSEQSRCVDYIKGMAYLLQKALKAGVNQPPSGLRGDPVAPNGQEDGTRDKV